MLFLYAAALSANNRIGTAVTTSFGAASSQSEAEGLAMQTCHQRFPAPGHWDYRVSVVLIPLEFMSRTGFQRIPD